VDIFKPGFKGVSLGPLPAKLRNGRRFQFKNIEKSFRPFGPERQRGLAKP